jgi:VWFA-related protein
MSARIIVALALVPLAVAGATTSPVARSTVAETSLYVTVESGGIPISGLTAANFELLQDGERMPFHLAPAEQPAQILVLVENTAGARRMFEGEIQMALESLSAAAGGRHAYALATYGTRFRLVFDFGRKAGWLGRELPEPDAGEPALWDAMYEAAERLDAREGRRVLVLVSSGDDLSRTVTRNTVRDRLRESNLVLYVCGVGSDLRLLVGPGWASSAGADPSATEFELRGLAVGTGGAAWFPASHGLAAAMANLTQRVDGAYRLVYAPRLAFDGRVHPITVRAWTTPADGVRRRLDVVAKDAWRLPPSDSEE